MKLFYMFFMILSVAFWTSTVSAFDINAESLKTAIKNNNYDAVKALIEQGVNVNYRDNDGNPLLNTALKKNRLKIAKLLIDSGADVNAPSSEDGVTPMIIATSRANNLKKQAEKIMAKDGGYVQKKAKEANLKKNIARQMNIASKILKLLIDSGADVNQETPFGTPLMNASTNPWNIELIRILLKADAQVDIQDRSGRTALFYGETFGGSKISSILLSAGADVDIKDANGKTYMEVTKEDFEEN